MVFKEMIYINYVAADGVSTRCNMHQQSIRVLALCVIELSS